MRTTDLIDQLAGGLRPTMRHAALRRLARGLVIGALAAFAVVFVYFGLRADLEAALLTVPFWMKWGFAFAVMAIALVMCVRLSRPEGRPGELPLALATPLLMLGVIAVIQLARVPETERLALWLGHSALRCPWNIAALSIPLVVGVLWAMRGLAPTRLRWAGFSAGCLAGAAAAVVYAIHCTETEAPFVATWYSLGILLPALFGLAIGPRVLRW
jgi:hypothetical protein